MDGQVAREVTAKYAFMGPGVELERTLSLHDDEHAIISGRVISRYRGHGLGADRKGFLRLSTKRLCILRVYLFRPDRIVEIPRGAVTRLDLTEPPLRIHFRGPRGEEEIGVVMAAEVGTGDHRGTLKQATTDVLEFGVHGPPGVMVGGGGNPGSLERIAKALDAWIAASYG